jgi:hypothetical protein
MEEMLGISASGHLAPSLSVAPPPLPEGEVASSGEVRRPSFAPPAEWTRPEGSRGSIDLGVLEHTERISHPPTLKSALDRWAPRLHEGTSLGVSEGGLLVVAPQQGEVMVVRERALALRGAAATSRAAHVAVSVGQRALLGPHEGESIHTVSLGDGEILYVVERYLLAYEAVGGGDARTIEAGATSLRVVAVRGRASLALTCARRPLAISTDGEAVGVSAAHLVGWSGHLFPGGTGDALVLRGEGTVLVA